MNVRKLRLNLALIVALGAGWLSFDAAGIAAQSPPVITRIVAAGINLDAPVVKMDGQTLPQNGILKRVWKVPNNAAGWRSDSKLPGQGGNIVLAGYSNKNGEVFRNIEKLEPGDTITLYQNEQSFTYTVVHKIFLKDKNEPDSVQQANERWFGPINEERLTLVSDWPYVNSTHKVIVVAWPEGTTPLRSENYAPDSLSASDAAASGETPPSLADNPLVAEVEVPGPDTSDPASIPLAVPDSLPITRLVAPAIGLNTPVEDIGLRKMESDGVIKSVWQVADYAAGWHKNSKKPGQGGNIVFSGHHNIKGQVFRYLVNLEANDLITIYQGNTAAYYVVTDKVIVKEKDEPPEVKRENAKWIGPTNEERLTLVSCWPYNSNTHRLIVVAKPVPVPAKPVAVDPLVVEQHGHQPADTLPSTLGEPAAIFSKAPSPLALPSPITRIVADSIKLDVPVVEAGWRVVERDGKPVKVWVLPDEAAGWHKDSKLPGQRGNIVLSGYHNTQGEVFRHIVDLNQGDEITLYTGETPHRYRVADKLILKDQGEPEAVRQQNARWIGQMPEERLTLVTGWPYQANTHRVVVIARPVVP